MWTHETDAHFRGDFRDRRKKFWKPNDVSAGIVAVRVDVLSQKKHFFVPVVAHASHRIHQNGDRYRPFLTLLLTIRVSPTRVYGTTQ